MEYTQEKANKKINALEEIIKKFPVVPKTFTYINIYQSVQQLYQHEEYKKVIDICNVIIYSDDVKIIVE